MSIRVLIRDSPSRSIALATDDHVLVFRHSASASDTHNPNASSSSLNEGAPYRCMVEFTKIEHAELEEYRSLSSLNVYGTLGLVTLQNDVFLCVVSGASKVATVRPGESVLRIHAVEFHCLSSSHYDHILSQEVNPYPTDTLDDDGFDYGSGLGKGQGIQEHPALALKKLLSSGTFYYSADFDLTKRLQERATDAATIALDSLEGGFLWNSYMIQPLVEFRRRLSPRQKEALDASRILTSAIRGFVMTMSIPPSSSPARTSRTGLPSALTLISRLSCRRAGTRFNSRGIDDDGNVANFVESETVFWSPSSGLCFSYVQVRGSVPLFWEQATGLLPHQQKISITRSADATQPAFDKHFEGLEVDYGAVHIVNLLSRTKDSEAELAEGYHFHIRNSKLNRPERDEKGDIIENKREPLQETQYDFHAETKGPEGYEAAKGVMRYIQDSADRFAYFLSQEVEDDTPSHHMKATTILEQEGVFRTNCLDCLDRTNVVQTIISQMAINEFLASRSERGTPDFWARHGSLWADNGDALSRIYAGTGALKSSFTRGGKMTLAGALADVRKSATRLYVNNFADKGRQQTIDMLLGRLMGQAPVHLYDPINDYVTMELQRRAGEFSKTSTIHIYAGTFNLNGRTEGIQSDLSPWLCPPLPGNRTPDIAAVGFQEIVELTPQQIMSTDPARRQAWEKAVTRILNENARRKGEEDYVILRGGQLVGASLSLFVKKSVLPQIKNVEGVIKKTGLSGMAGNKGAVAIRLDFNNTSMCFVTAHLAAGFANYEERNRDYKTISHGLRFQRNRCIEDHDTIIWLGDFNYRIGLGYDKVRHLIEMGDLAKLYENDQLNLQMVYALTFPYYSEMRITFDPTYKYDLGTDNYDSSEKQRIPAWCDRILRKGDNIRQLSYDAAPLRFSDHRPVFATFECDVNIIDTPKKEQLAYDLYFSRKQAMSGGRLGSVLESDLIDTADEDDVEEVEGYEAIEPGLPPASSQRRKWWLDNGHPARSTLTPPTNGQVPNPKRPFNPFIPSDEPDWVKVAHQPPLPARSREASVTSLLDKPNGLQAPGTRRKLPVPLPPPSRELEEDHVPPALPRRPTAELDGSNESRPPVTQSRAVPIQRTKSGKPVPSVPRKPAILSAQSTGGEAITPSTERRMSFTTAPEGLTPTISNDNRPISFPSNATQTPLPPPPRRIGTPNRLQKLPSSGSTTTLGTLGKKASSSTLTPAPVAGKLRKTPSPQRQARMDGGERAGMIPSLPPRRDTKPKDIMNDGDEMGMESLKDWEVLKPG